MFYFVRLRNLTEKGNNVFYKPVELVGYPMQKKAATRTSKVFFILDKAARREIK